MKLYDRVSTPSTEWAYRVPAGEQFIFSIAKMRRAGLHVTTRTNAALCILVGKLHVTFGKVKP